MIFQKSSTVILVTQQCVGKPEGNQMDLTAFAFSDFLHTFRYLDMIDKVGGNHAKVQSNLPIVNR